MAKKYLNQDLIDIPEISQDFMKMFCPSLTRQEIIKEISQTFENIYKKRKDIILDVKGIIPEEEKIIVTNRDYAKMNWLDYFKVHA